jgi:hypothetical protein
MTDEVMEPDRLFTLEKVIFLKIDAIKYGFLDIGKALYEINAGRLWAAQYASFEEYLKSTYPFSKSWAYAIMKISLVFGGIIEAEDIDVDVTRCFKLLPYVKEDNAEELLRMAAGTSYSGFEDNIRNMKSQKGHDECDHGEWIVIKKCGKCGFSKQENK